MRTHESSDHDPNQIPTKLVLRNKRRRIIRSFVIFALMMCLSVGTLAACQSKDKTPKDPERISPIKPPVGD